MKILAISGTHPRHLYYFNTIHKVLPLCGAIIVSREEIIPKPPKNLAKIDKHNFIRHFRNRYAAEKKYFGKQPLFKCLKLQLKSDDLNSSKSVFFLKKINPDVVLIFGTGLIKEPLYSAVPYNTINLHLGLSPRYRGSATLFWPFYFMQPNYAGSTFHFIVGEPDAGDIIHQVVPKLEKTDHIHDVACKTVIASANVAVRLLGYLQKTGKWNRYKQRGTGKNFLSNDFMPEHLRVIYNLFDDDMVKQYLEGKIRSRKPKLIRQF